METARTTESTDGGPGRWLFAVVFGALAWWLFIGEDGLSWLVGAPCIAVAAVAFARLTHRVWPPLRWWRIPGFAVWYTGISMVAGWDVARRALLPGMRLDPGLLRYRTALPPGLPLVLFGAAISLVPGSLTVKIEDRVVTVHVVDLGQDNASALRQLESRIGWLFGVDPQPEELP